MHQQGGALWRYCKCHGSAGVHGGGGAYREGRCSRVRAAAAALIGGGQGPGAVQPAVWERRRPASTVQCCAVITHGRGVLAGAAVRLGAAQGGRDRVEAQGAAVAAHAGPEDGTAVVEALVIDVVGDGNAAIRVRGGVRE